MLKLGVVGPLEAGTPGAGIETALRGTTVGLTKVVMGLTVIAVVRRGLSAGTIGVLDKMWTSLFAEGGIGLKIGSRGGI